MSRGGRARRTLIPAYGEPAALTALVERRGQAGTVVVNPASGPGGEPQQRYRALVEALRGAGRLVLGYVPTTYGVRSPEAAHADVDRWEAWYGVDGVFLDEATTGSEGLPYYELLALHVRSAGRRLVAVNCGAVPAPGYFAVADVVVTFEGPFDLYARARERMPPWLDRVPAGRIAHLVYSASRGQALEAAGATDVHAGHLYLTSGSLPDPWRALPPYLHDEESRLAGVLGPESVSGGREPSLRRFTGIGDTLRL